MTLPPCAAAANDEMESIQHNTPHVIAYFSIVADSKTKDANSERQSANLSSENDGAATSQTAVPSDTDNLVQVIKSVLKNRSQSLHATLRHWRLEKNRPCQQSTHKAKDSSETTYPSTTREHLCAPQIEIKVSGNVFVDITSISLLSALVAPAFSEFHGDDNEWQLMRRHHSSCCTKQQQQQHCPLYSLAAFKPEWWDRPLWAWTWKEMILAHGAMLARDIVKALVGDMKWNVVVATDKCVAQLPSIHWHYNKSSCRERQFHMPFIIDPAMDSSVIRRVVEKDMSRAMSETDLELARTCQQLLEHYFLDKEDIANKECRDEINSLIQSTREDSGRMHSPHVEGNEPPIALTPENAKKEVKDEAPIATEVTPESERCNQVRTDDKNGECTKAQIDCERGDTERGIDNVQTRSLTKAPHRPRSPQYDSSGIDMTILSQLPASIRSEARIAYALSESASISRRRQKPAARGSLPTWFPRVDKQEGENTVAHSVSSTQRKSSWLTVGDVDPQTLSELPPDIQAMIRSELSQGSGRPQNRKRSDIASFFHTTAKRYK